MNPDAQPVSESRSVRTARFFNHLHRLKNQLRRHWWLLPLAVIAGLGLQVFLMHRTPPSFVSLGRMIVNIKLQMPTGSATYTEELSNFLGTQVALMQSGTVLNRAGARAAALLPGLAPAPVQLRITVSPKTSIFNLVARGGAPEYTRAYLDACMEEYINLKREMRSSTSDMTLAGVTAELARLEGDLKQAEQEMFAFQSSNSVVFLEEQGSSAGSYLAKLNRQLADLQLEAHLLKTLSLDQNLDRQRKRTAPAPAAGEGDTGAGIDRVLGADADYLKVKQEIHLLKAEQKERSEYLRPKHPKMIELAARLEQKEKLLEILRTQSLEQWENRRTAIDLQIESLKREVKDWEQKSIDISQKMAEYQRLKANNTRLQGHYDRMLAIMQTLGMDKSLNPESVTILEKATRAELAAGDSVQKLILSALAGLAAGLLLLLLLDRFDDRPASFTDLQETFDEPVLCQVPYDRELTRNGKPQLLGEDDARHALRESYRSLRSSLLCMASDAERPRTILVTSALPVEGKSMTAANLAITLANGGAKVLLIDADLRKGLLHERFAVAAAPGLCEVLSSQADPATALRQTPAANLTLLPRGQTTLNPSELFLTNTARNLLADFAARYEWVILDSAPVMAADDVATLSPRIDGVIFVLRANQTPARIARAALDLLYQRNVTVLGLAFNAVRPDASDYYYKYKSYYGVKARE